MHNKSFLQRFTCTPVFESWQPKLKLHNIFFFSFQCQDSNFSKKTIVSISKGDKKSNSYQRMSINGVRRFSTISPHLMFKPDMTPFKLKIHNFFFLFSARIRISLKNQLFPSKRLTQIQIHIREQFLNNFPSPNVQTGYYTFHIENSLYFFSVPGFEFHQKPNCFNLKGWHKFKFISGNIHKWRPTIFNNFPSPNVQTRYDTFQNWFDFLHKGNIEQLDIHSLWLPFTYLWRQHTRIQNPFRKW